MLDLLLLLASLFAGGFIGWWLRGGVTSAARRGGDTMLTGGIVQRLHSIAENVATNLGEHQERMRRIHDRLSSTRGSVPEDVLMVVQELLECNEEMQRELQSAEDRLQHQADELHSHAQAARTDALTRVANRRAFDSMLADCHAAFQATGEPTTLLMLDVDHFKQFNDRFGHPAGDAVLRGVAQLLSQRLADSGTVCRYGGEEFAVVFSGGTIRDVAEQIIEAHRAIAETGFPFDGTVLRITASIGVAEFTESDDPSSLIHRADEALYVSKHKGRNCCHRHTGSAIEPLLERRDQGARFGDVVAIERETLDRADLSAGVSNRDTLIADVARRIDQLESVGTSYSMLLLVIDDFDEVLSEHGESAARAVSRAATLLVKAGMRDIDHVGSFDDGTLALILPGVDRQQAVAIAERLRDAVSRCRLSASRFPPQQFSISVGVAEPLPSESESELMERLTRSLEQATAGGRNCTYVHDGQSCQLVGAGHVSLAAAKA